MKTAWRIGVYGLGLVSMVALLVAFFMIEIGGESVQTSQLLLISAPIFLICAALVYYDGKKRGFSSPAKPIEHLLPFETYDAFFTDLQAQLAEQEFRMDNRAHNNVAFYWKKVFAAQENLGVIIASAGQTPAQLHGAIMQCLNSRRSNWSVCFIGCGYGVPQEWEHTLSVSTRVMITGKKSNIDAHAFYDLQTHTLYLQKITQGTRHCMGKAIHDLWNKWDIRNE